MPIQLSDGDLLEAVFYTRLGSQNGLMVHHYEVSGSVGLGGSLEEGVAAIALGISSLITVCLSNAATYDGVTLKRLSPNPSDKVTSITGAGPGTVISDPMSSQTAGLITLRTGIAGRRFRGRKYIPFPPETYNTATGVPDVAYLAAASLLAGGLLLPHNIGMGGNTCTLTPVIYSRAGNATTNIASATVRSQWATQRRRSQINRGDLPFVP